MARYPHLVILIGYRASGKTTVAKLLADRLDTDWFDSDLRIADAAKRSIEQIFAEDGEGEFRRLEREFIASVIALPCLVLSTGGGAILNEQTRAEMKATGRTVWLRASADELAKRISSDQADGKIRPSLTGKPVAEEVAEVLAIREQFYAEAASIIVDTEGLSPEQVVDRICSQLELVDSADTDADQSAGESPC